LKINQFTYSISWRSKNNRYGSNLSSKIGNDFEYSGSKNFNDHPDLTRIDIKNSITDPYENIYVKTYNLNNPINLVALCDISSSVLVNKINSVLIKDISKVIAKSAISHGDKFSMLCYNDIIEKKLILEPGNNQQYINQWINSMKFDKGRVSSNAMKTIDKYLPDERSLVFWISDFHYPLDDIKKILNLLSTHHVIPLFISSEGEIKKLPKYGFRKFIDSEKNSEHEIFLRPSIKKKILLDYINTKKQIFDIFTKKQIKQIVLNEKIDIKEIQKYFLSTHI